MITYWHNPRCSKSRAGLAFFEEKGAEIDLRLYQNDGPTREELIRVRDMLGVKAIDMMRNKDALFKELGLSADNSEDVLLQAMADHPALIERPIAFTRDKASIGRPTEALAALLD